MAGAARERSTAACAPLSPVVKVVQPIALFERLIVETHSNCNRACWFCPRTYDRSGKYLDRDGAAVLRRMPTEKVLDVLDQAQALGFGGRVEFHHYSEPLLDERNLDFARAARRRGMQPGLHTNGDVLRRDDALCLEVAEVYASIVVGLYDYTSTEELETEKGYWGNRLRGAQLEFSPIPADGGRAVKSIAAPRALVPTDARMAFPDLAYRHAPCHRPLIRMIIQYDGEMAHCCEDVTGAFQLGNVFEQTMAELWFGARHAEIVRDLIAGRREMHALCSTCPQSPTGRPPAGTRIELLPRRSGSLAR